ncbi:hypothetical protein HB13667_25160 [Pseudomonas putida]|jgi:hypothetical protein|uniref:Uncharacterized protein n=3 Tax=Pseudomonas TaxID=286 RepID=A0ABX4U143_PSEDL|nr:MULTISPECIES: hypothetical protein [Pseudomonas]TXG96648.1 MAG: hypothetical protein E6R08_08940 [Nevskiaceae bacterium]KPM59451.1 hypothetical protein HB13667_25160 [Pseudomonas putida]KYC19537.1 hypothetical protein WM94_18040 [Pseudomonas sp. ABFPK]MBO2922468.1 hypothetical protein [Pseudomonas asiatica]MCO7522961.1 hypothetical protein [Pseudomonas asiatica]
MTMSEAVSTGALVLIGVILAVLLMQYMKLRELWQLALACRHNARWARIREMENRELRSARRADQAHIAQLQRKLVLLQSLVAAEKG